MHIGDLDLNLVPVLDALFQEGSVSRAADRLGLTQSAMSHALRRLRMYFDDPLFVRGSGGMSPTPKAQELAPIVAEMMERVRSYLVPGAGFNPADTPQRSQGAGIGCAAMFAHDEAASARLPARQNRARTEIAVGHPQLPCLGMRQQRLRQGAFLRMAVFAGNHPRFLS